MRSSLTSVPHFPSDHVDADHRLITEARAREVYERIKSFQHGDGDLRVRIRAWWCGELRWARNRITIASDRREVEVWINRANRYGQAAVCTNQIDDETLAAGVRFAERDTQMGGGEPKMVYDGIRWRPPLLPFPDTKIWSEATFGVTPEQRSVLAQRLVEDAEARQLLSAGFLQMRVGEQMLFGQALNHWEKYTSTTSPEDLRREGSGNQRMTRDVGYVRYTESQCSMTVRHPKGLGSGWAGLSSFDWSAIDAGVLAKRAIEKCVNSLNPVAIEPGRYTVILEPQAVAFILDPLVAEFNYDEDNMDRGRQRNEDPDKRPGVWWLEDDQALGLRRTKLGLKIVDERISIAQNPMDPQLGILPELGLGPVTWVEHGILKELGYRRDAGQFDYALPFLTENLPVLTRASYTMTGGSTTVEEMIATTERGVVVSRFSPGMGQMIDPMSLLYSGFTRDGLWLVEKGKISKAVKNMRFTDSPLFVLNQLVQLGVPVPVFKPGETNDLRPTIVPPLKANDFAFTATADAI